MRVYINKEKDLFRIKVFIDKSTTLTQFRSIRKHLSIDTKGLLDFIKQYNGCDEHYRLFKKNSITFKTKNDAQQFAGFLESLFVMKELQNQ